MRIVAQYRAVSVTVLAGNRPSVAADERSADAFLLLQLHLQIFEIKQGRAYCGAAAGDAVSMMRKECRQLGTAEGLRRQILRDFPAIVA